MNFSVAQDVMNLVVDEEDRLGEGSVGRVLQQRLPGEADGVRIPGHPARFVAAVDIAAAELVLGPGRGGVVLRVRKRGAVGASDERRVQNGD